MKTKLLFHDEERGDESGWGGQLPLKIIGSNEEYERQPAGRTVEARSKSNQLRAMASELAQVERRERGQLAAILHDNIQQLLVGARLQISAVNQELLPVKDRQALSRANEIIKQAIAEARDLTMDLSPPILHGAGLGAALEWLAGRMAELHCFTVSLSIDPHAEPQAESSRILLFETLRELLFNSCKHSGCATVSVKITREPGHWIRVVVEDAGAGFDPRALAASMASGERLGLFRIQQRLAYVGARMALASEPGVGARFEIMMRIDDRDRIEQKREIENVASVLVGQWVS